MARKAGRKSTPKIPPPPPGFRAGHEVAAAGGGRVVVGNQLAKEERSALWLDETGKWRPFSEVPHFDPHFFRIPAFDSIFETGLWSRMRRPPVQTYKGMDWSESKIADFPVVISTLPTDNFEAGKPAVPTQSAAKRKRKSRRGHPFEYDREPIQKLLWAYIDTLDELPIYASTLIRGFEGAIDVANSKERDSTRHIHLPRETLLKEIAGPIHRRAKGRRQRKAIAKPTSKAGSARTKNRSR